MFCERPSVLCRFRYSVFCVFISTFNLISLTIHTNLFVGSATELSFHLTGTRSNAILHHQKYPNFGLVTFLSNRNYGPYLITH